MGHRHEIIPKEKLQKDVLYEIRQNHRLTKCPVCKEELVEPLCSEGIIIPRDLEVYRRYEHRGCNNCKIIWRLEIFNWTNERGDGMISGEGHQLFLEGWTNCFCKSSVFERHITIEDSEPHHSALGHPCPNVRKNK